MPPRGQAGIVPKGGSARRNGMEDTVGT
jgi:hypothetical protein